jgi:hypothetical protein
MDYPDDADGDALRRVAQDGSDMSRPMEIDFAVAAPDEASAVAIAEAAGGRGYRTAVVHEDGTWSCFCTRKLIATHNAVVRAQAELDALSRRHGGHPDGWGTSGNGPGSEPRSRTLPAPPYSAGSRPRTALQIARTRTRSRPITR